MRCRHNFVYSQGHFRCTKCHKRGKQQNYRRNTSKKNNAKIFASAAITGIIVLVLVVGYYEFDSINREFDNINTEIDKISLESIKIPDIEFPEISYTPTPTSIEESQKNIQYINQIRRENGLASISFDQRAYELALARVQDINEFNYFEHTNPVTGTCADTWKNSFGFLANEYVAENLADGIYSANGAVDLWMTSTGHRTNLLWNSHTAGATVCESSTCAFLGVNFDRYGAGCY